MQERVWLPLPGLKQYRAEFLALVRTFAECHRHEVVSDCKGVVKAVPLLLTGRRTPKGCNRLRTASVECASALPENYSIRWMKVHLKQTDVDSGSRVTADDPR
eukprot:28935-Amphidinium_carterae.1